MQAATCFPRPCLENICKASSQASDPGRKAKPRTSLLLASTSSFSYLGSHRQHGLLTSDFNLCPILSPCISSILFFNVTVPSSTQVAQAEPPVLCPLPPPLPCPCIRTRPQGSKTSVSVTRRQEAATPKGAQADNRVGLPQWSNADLTNTTKVLNQSSDSSASSDLLTPHWLDTFAGSVPCVSLGRRPQTDPRREARRRRLMGKEMNQADWSANSVSKIPPPLVRQK